MTDPHATPPGESPRFQPKEPQSPAMTRRHDSTARTPLSRGAQLLAVVLVFALLAIVVAALT